MLGLAPTLAAGALAFAILGGPTPSLALGVAATADGSQPVTGTSWSAPAFPVDCFAASGQVSCTPQDPAQVRAQQCFIGVPFEGATAMVCTTFEGHQEALRAAGGSAVLVNYGCSIGDLVCTTFENFGRGMAIAATAAAFAMAISTSFDTTSPLWSAAVNE